ncbi:MAG TPA: hypothetical protein VM095_21295 [Pyrinomonadaceae bacterium]|nr:hypothetical protein [Pyrinomonadaceae bacterium]
MLQDWILRRNSKRWKAVQTFNRFGSSIAVVLVLALSVTSLNQVYSISEQAQTAPYDGITLYRGLFFASGPVVNKIATLNKASRYFTPEYKGLEGQVIKYLQGNDPTFFDNFAREIQSGDRARVAAVIRNTNKLQREALIAVTRKSRSRFASQVRQLTAQAEPSPDTDVAKDIAIIVILYVPVITMVVAADKAMPVEMKGLKFDQYVDEIVKAVPKMRTTPQRIANPGD